MRTFTTTMGITALLASAGLASVRAVADMRTADQVSAQFNQTGRAMPMTIALRDNGRSLGDVTIRIEKDDGISVSKASLLALLQAEAAPETLARLAVMPDMVPLATLKAAGVDMKFDKQQIVLVMGLTAHQRKDGDISFAAPAPLASGAIVRPSTISGYINLFAQSDYLWNTNQTALRFEAEAAIRVGNFVFESEFAVENDVNAQVCPSGALCLFDHSSGFKRRGSRVVYDSVEWQNRLTVGDTRTNTTTFQRGPDVLGFSLEHAPTKLDPMKPIRATGAQSFVMERPGTVDVLINGAVAQRLHLPPGTFNLRDLPLRAGANEITLLITDDTGATRTLSFNTFSAYSLLGVGKSEWSITGGVPSTFRDGEIAYVDNQYLASAFARYGLTNQVTIESHVQADNHVVMGGAGAVMATPFGIWGLQVAASQADANIGTGGAVRITWDLTGKKNLDSLRLAAEWHTSGFRTPGQLQTAPNGIIFPVFDAKMSYSGAYTLRLPENWQMAVTARYDVANDEFTSGNLLVAHGDRYHVDLSLTHPLWDNASISGTVGYSNEVYNRSFSNLGTMHLNDTKGELWAGLRLFWRPEPKTVATASSDTLNKRTFATGTYQSSPGIDSWTSNVTVADDRIRGDQTVSGSSTYRGQRAEVTVGHDSGLQVLAPGRSDVEVGQQRSRMRVGTALVFAGDTAAVSAPVRGDGGFAILSPHASIGDRAVMAGTPGYLRAHSDAFGPAVVTGMAAYVPQTLPIDVADLPTGYSLGASGFDLLPPYKAGYKLQVGSGYSVSAFGELRDQRGEPLGLVAGIASNGSKQVTVFTNQGGKFAADGLAEGRWTLTMETDDGRAVYTIEVPPRTQGLLRLGTLTPTKG